MSDIYDQLREPFPDAAHSADTSRGFELTSIKAGFVIERLNHVFGLCGTGWRYAHRPMETVTNLKQEVEFIVEVALQYRVEDEKGAAPLIWQHALGQWTSLDPTQIHWSAPVFAYGGKRPAVKGGSNPFTDAYKSAVTNGITKAASMLGVGEDVFKGQVRVGKQQRQPQQATQAKRERATQPAAAASDDGKQKFPDRPWSPKWAKSALHIRAAQASDDPDRKATKKQAGTLARNFQEIWTDDSHAEDKYHCCLEWIWEVSSANDLTFGQASATISWLKADKDSWDLNVHTITEANLILDEAMKDAGQTDMFDDSVEVHQEEFEELTANT